MAAYCKRVFGILFGLLSFYLSFRNVVVLMLVSSSTMPQMQRRNPSSYSQQVIDILL
ncbi:hypothetical protein MANES_11G003950v8 [Manihot esculenta]|uniref:Uncharacterized protein n=1 Tax=Manihot esculenta TaxID=3983 RepID=A0ACB7GS26_MANES|nr:hypothetical protein MANES_11G003950v8 [Manihot esculenta]